MVSFKSGSDVYMHINGRELFRRVIVALSVTLLREKDSCEVVEAFVGL